MLFIIFPVFLLLGLVVFPEKIKEETFFETTWYCSLETIKPFTPGNQTALSYDVIPFITADKLGYIDKSGSLIMNLDRGSGSIICSDKWSVWNTPVSEKTIQLLSGEKLSIPQNEIPFFYGERIFAVSSDTLTITEYDSEGKLLWKYMLPCHVSAFAANKTITVLGFVNGDIIVLDNEGNEISTTRVGGSRIEVILGLAISDSGKYVAAIAGIDDQRLVVFERGQKNYRVIKHKYLKSNFRNQVNIYITSDESYILYKDMSGIGVFGITKNKDTLFSIPADKFYIYEGSPLLGICLVSEFLQERTVHVVKMPDIILGKIKLPSNSTYFYLKEDTMFFDDGSGIAAISFK